MKKYLILEIEEITPELLERFKASGEWILAHTVSEFWDGKTPAKEFNTIMMMHWDGEYWTDNDVIYDEPTHYLPDGLPDPSAAVELFESEVYPSWDRDSEPMHEMYSEKTHEDLPYGTKLGVFALPAPLEPGKVTQEGE
jgi:hypothetical protein